MGKFIRRTNMIQQNSQPPRVPPILNAPRQAPPLPLDPRPADVENLLNPTRIFSMQEYAAVLSDLPIPTALQRANFVDYVTISQSWYKALPIFPPGAPFYLFIDRFAGCDYRASFFVERHKYESHHSIYPTAEYRRRFGHLSYCCAWEVDHLLERKSPAVPWEELAANLRKYAQLSVVPRPFLDAGRVELTAVIHPGIRSRHFWRRSDWLLRPGVSWPGESGGEATLKKIFERCAEMNNPEYDLAESRERRKEALQLLEVKGQLSSGSEYFPGIDPVLHELLEPERERQKREMLKAIDRIYMVLHEARR